MFSGVSYLVMDDKNRIAMPAKYRDTLINITTTKLVITLESNQCLLLYPETTWEIVRNKIENLTNSSHPLVKSFQRLILGHAEVITLDKAGRLLVPSTLRSMLNLEHELALVGMGSKFELWSKSQWDIETSKALCAPSEELANLLNGLSI